MSPDRALHGPAVAGNFRVSVGRYRERWYTDPLPACDIAPESEWVGPSVSTTKPPFANRYYTLRGIADMPSAEWARLAGLDAEERYEAVKVADKIAGRINMSRGSIVHRWAEDRLLGRTPIPGLDLDDRKALEQAERFRPALDQFFDHYQPETFAVEAVCLHRDLHDVGYGGTLDAIVWIDGELWVVDWKSRNSDHAAYLEEAAQGGAYIGAQYMIVAGDDGTPKRIRIPDVAGVLIVSIREDGYRAFPIATDGAVEAYRAMHRWWVAQRAVTENKVIGRPWAPRATAPAEPPATPDRRASIIARIKKLIEDGHGETLSKRWPEGIPGFGTTHPHTDAEIAAVHAVVQRLEDDNGYGFHPDDAPPPEPTPEPVEPELPPAATVLDDGKVVTVEARAELNNRYAALDPDARARVDQLRALFPPRTTPDGRPYLRHWLYLSAVVTWAESGCDEDDFYTLASVAVDGHAANFADLTIEQAQRLNDMAAQLAA